MSKPFHSKEVPFEPTPEMWGGIARDIIMWMRMGNTTGKSLHAHLNALGRDIPAWLIEEIPLESGTPPKGTVATVIYKAMICAAPPSCEPRP